MDGFDHSESSLKFY